jgi:hypothetical protein
MTFRSSTWWAGPIQHVAFGLAGETLESVLLRVGSERFIALALVDRAEAAQFLAAATGADDADDVGVSLPGRGWVLALCEDREGWIWDSDNEALYRLNPKAGP